MHCVIVKAPDNRVGESLTRIVHRPTMNVYSAANSAPQRSQYHSVG